MKRKHLRALTGVMLAAVLALTPAGSAVVPVFGAEARDEISENAAASDLNEGSGAETGTSKTGASENDNEKPEAEHEKNPISKDEVSEESIVLEDTARASEPAASADAIEEEAGDIEDVNAVWGDYKCLLDKTNKRLTLIEYTGEPVSSIIVPASAKGVRIKNEGESETEFNEECTVCVGGTDDYYISESVWNGTSGTLASLTLENGVQCNQRLDHLFDGLSNLTSLSMNNLDTSNVTDMESMFSHCENLTSLDLSNFKTSNVTNMDSMFFYCEDLTSLDLSGFITSNVTDMGSMFSGCQKLTSLDLSNFKTSNVTDMESMFYYCEGLTSLDLSGFNTSSVIVMRGMFSGCQNLTSLNVSNFDISKVTDMDSMFSDCQKLTSLNVSNFDTSNVTDMRFMFSNCQSLSSLNVSNFNTSNVTDMNSMFSNCQSLSSLNVSKFDTSNVTDMNSMFSGCQSLTSLDLSKFDTSNVTDMSYMFHYCQSLTSLNVSKFKTSNVTNMNSMFWNCENLTSLDVSNFNTSNVTDMEWMFLNCENLTSLDVSNFNTSNVTDMGAMFSGCRSLTSLNVSNFDTSNVTDMGGMFNYCESLTSLDVSNFDTSGVSYFKGMFSYCTKLEKIDGDLANFSGDSANPDTGLDSILDSCKSIKNINLSGFTAFNSNALNGCTSINKVVFPDKVTTLDTGATPLQGSFYTPLTLNTVTFDSKLGDADLHVYGPAAIQSVVVALNSAEGKGSGTAYFHELSSASPDYPYRDKVYATGLKLSRTEAELKYNDSQGKGTSVTLTADILPADASNQNVRWSVEEGYIRVVRYDASLRKAKFIARGCPFDEHGIIVTATSGDGKAKAICTIHITGTDEEIPDEPEDVKVTGVTLDRPVAEVAVNNSIKLNATVAPADAADKRVTWSSSDNSIATVDSEGNVTGKKAGVTTITVTTKDGKKTAKCLVTVINVPLVKISLPESVTVEKGKNAEIPVTFTPPNASNKNLVWTVSDPSVARVENGTVTGLAVGTTVVTARSEDGGHEASCTITVKEAEPEPEPQPQEDTFYVVFWNEGVYFDSVRVKEGETASEPARVPTSKTPGNEFVGWVDEGGLWNFSTPIYQNITLNAKYILKTPETVSKNTGSGMDPVAQVSGNVIYLVRGQVYTAGSDGWSIKSGGGISLVKGTGKITAKKRGHYIVEHNGSEITVAVADPSFNKYDKKRSIYQGDRDGISLTINPAEKGEEKFYNVAWTSDNPMVAAVDNGVITGVGKGTTKINAHVGGKTYASSVTVSDTIKAPSKCKGSYLSFSMNPLQSVNISFDSKVFTVKGAEWNDEKGEMISTSNNRGNPDGGYKNSVISITKAGKVTAIGSGETHLIGKDVKSRTVDVYIRIRDTSSGRIDYVLKNRTKTLKIPFVNNNKALWDSSDKKIISDFAKGKIKGKEVGSSKISCSYNGFNFTTLAYVEDPEFEIKAGDDKLRKNGNKYEMSLKVGDIYNRVRMKNTFQTVSFKSSKPAAAFIDENGVIYARSKGKTNITTKINGKTFKIAVTVTE